MSRGDGYVQGRVGMSRGEWVYPGVGIPWNLGYLQGVGILWDLGYPPTPLGTDTWWQPPKHVRLSSGWYPFYWNAFLFLFADEEASLCVDALNLGSKQVIMMAVNDHSSAYSAGGSHW